jgi:hypothetical protein
MRIIDKYKDYYDYLTGVFGIDNSVFFDRRGSTKLTQSRIIKLLDTGRKGLYLIPTPTKTEPKTYGRNVKLYGIIEAGYYQYLISAFNIVKYVVDYDDNNAPIIELDGELKLLYTFDDHKHYLSSPLSIYAVRIRSPYSWKKYEYDEKQKLNYANDIVCDYIEDDKGRGIIEKPIFANTKIPSIIDANTLYVNIFDYISSKADFDIIDTRSDVSKAVDHGFDKVTSFRNM